MRKLVVLLAVTLAATSMLRAQEDIVMTLGDENVTLSDFKAIFLKNNRDSVFSKQDLDDYVELFINFKLKVAEARSLGMDTATQFVNELSGYRKQLTRPYLTDGDLLDELVAEAYERKTQEVRASHILVNCALDAAPSDTLQAYQRIVKLRNRILAGEAFESVARGMGGSDDPSVAQNGGDLGYFSVFQMVWPFEEAAYNTPVGEISMPVRTRFGYHLLKVKDRRAAQGEIRAAHILVRAKPEDENEVSRAKDKIDNIKRMLDEGGNFEEMALKFSEDAATARRGGEMPWFGSGQMMESFEQAAFGLENDGDISEPVQTTVGWHIVKRLDKKEVAPFDEVEKEIRNRVRRDARAQVTQASFLNKLAAEYGYTVDAKILQKGFKKSLDTSVFSGSMVLAKEKYAALPLITWNDQQRTSQEFLDYLNAKGIRSRESDPQLVLDEALKDYRDRELLAYEDRQLETKYDEFRLLMNEYRDGILLFELTDEMVWSKAVKDTLGLEAFRERNASKYMWGERANAGTYRCISEDLAKQVKKQLKKGKPANEIVVALNTDGPLNVRYEEERFERGANALLDRVAWETGVSDIVEMDGQFWVVNIMELLPPEPKGLDDARGLITADYQEELEQQWIQQLRAKYSFNVNRDVLYKLVSE